MSDTVKMIELAALHPMRTALETMAGRRAAWRVAASESKVRGKAQRLLHVLAALAALQLSACLRPYTAMEHSQQPEVRVGLILAAAQAQFEVADEFTVRSAEGRLLASSLKGGTWAVTAGDETQNLLTLQARDGAQQFSLPSGFEMQAGEMSLALANGERRTYHGRLRFHRLAGDKIAAVNVLPVEHYLAGVLPAEMNAQFPLAALKAQAIAARSEVMLKLRQKNQAEIYDICGDASCQAYAGKGKRSALTDRAVTETFGLVLATPQRDIVNAPYSSVCGGHTENNEQIWSGHARPHLRGVYDGSASTGVAALANEDSLRLWLAESPPAYCNLTAAAVPAGLAYSRKYFRWQFTFSATELRDNIRKQTGEDFGDLLALQPLSRGVSGRITRLRVSGTKKSFEINRELAIRQALSPQTLWSSLFVIDRTAAANGGVAEFTLRGAGAGHGVGMCQIGAARMALAGSSQETILAHYYTGVRIMRAY